MDSRIPVTNINNKYDYMKFIAANKTKNFCIACFTDETKDKVEAAVNKHNV